MILDYSKQQLQAKGAAYTASEITQQPAVWKQIISLYENKKDKIDAFLHKTVHAKTKIYLVGAGTSEFIGAAVVNELKRNGYDIASVASTDLVSAPEVYFTEKHDYLMVSFARSGNSPESYASLLLAQQFVKTRLSALTITCQANSNLIEQTKAINNHFVYVLPPQTNDHSFAMTSSYSAMLLTCLLILSKNKQVVYDSMQIVCRIVTKFLAETGQLKDDYATKIQGNVVLLGSNDLKAVAEEGALKILELTQGIIPTFYNSALGFRHGSKSILNAQSTVIFLLSKNSYTRKYDLDLLKELYDDQQVTNIIVLDFGYQREVKAFADVYYCFYENHALADVYVGLIYVVCLQTLALFLAIREQISPDNPCPSGRVNRVVKGVTIHDYFLNKA